MHYIGVDVGTGSVRAVLVRYPPGEIISKAVESIGIHNPRKDFYLQSSKEIWNAVVKCIKAILREVEVEVKGIGFDATCSLVVLDKDGEGIR